MSHWKNNVRRAISVLVIATILSTFPLLGSSQSVSTQTSVRTETLNSQLPFSYGLDWDGIPFAQKADGTKGRFIDLSPTHIRLQVAKQRPMGEMEIRWLSKDELVVSFTSSDGESFFVTSTLPARNEGGQEDDSSPTSNNKQDNTKVTLQFRNQRVILNSKEIREAGQLPSSVEKELVRMVADVRTSDTLQSLMGETQFFGNHQWGAIC